MVIKGERGGGKERGMIYRKKVENKCCNVGEGVVECGCW